MPEPIEQTVIIRYANQSGAIVEVVKSADSTHTAFSAKCTACLDAAQSSTALRPLRSWAQTHSETCRALPQPEGGDQQ